MSLKKTKIMFPVFFSVLGSFKYLFWASLLCLLSLLFCPSQHPYRSALFGPSVHPFYSAAAAASPPKYNYLWNWVFLFRNWSGPGSCCSWSPPPSSCCSLFTAAFFSLKALFATFHLFFSQTQRFHKKYQGLKLKFKKNDFKIWYSKFKKSGWPDWRFHRPNRKFGRYFEPVLIKMHKKPKFRVLGDIFSSAYVVKYVFGQNETLIFGLVNLATLNQI